MTSLQSGGQALCLLSLLSWMGVLLVWSAVLQPLAITHSVLLWVECHLPHSLIISTLKALQVISPFLGHKCVVTHRKFRGVLSHLDTLFELISGKKPFIFVDAFSQCTMLFSTGGQDELESFLSVAKSSTERTDVISTYNHEGRLVTI